MKACWCVSAVTGTLHPTAGVFRAAGLTNDTHLILKKKFVTDTLVGWLVENWIGYKYNFLIIHEKPNINSIDTSSYKSVPLLCAVLYFTDRLERKSGNNWQVKGR